MTIQEVQRQMQKQPFEPFRVLTADGRHYDVLHPEHLASSGKGRLIAIGMPDDSFVTWISCWSPRSSVRSRDGCRGARLVDRSIQSRSAT